MSFVLDNSVAMAWCFKDEHTPAVMSVLDRTVALGAFAPSLWPIEALNGLFVAERRKRLTAAQRLEFMTFLHDLPIMLDTETADLSWTVTAQLADRFGLTLYDATYLELARRRRCPLASLDRQLRTAATALGVELLGS